MFKKTLYIIGLAALVSLVLVGCGKSQDSSQSSKPNGAGQTSKKVAASSTTSTSSSSMSSTASSSSSQTNQSTPTNLDSKTLGVLVMVDHWPGYLEEHISLTKANGIYYGYVGPKDIAKKVRGYQYLTAEGDAASVLYYKLDNGQVDMMEWTARNTEVDGYFKSSSISLSKLIAKHYSTTAQKNQINKYASQVRPESQYGK
ncbi:hypothetical protein RZ70_08940 [Apilactobacillus kunkeei]|uniref:Lreu_0056 family protein n=1 Tax=Apilactobacillus kunkeei TaxID=148814 RepID=UPI0006C5F57F|nr:hypothetical protein [Apilactobacillus kunkeei]KOY75532.1 hypothetical protein RZ70_08940 [Apilactobacillus kunkeei]